MGQQVGVEGYVICNKQGQVLRRFPTTWEDDAEKYARSMISLVTQARGVVRDLNPKNELQFLRVRTKKHEVMVAFDVQFIVIIVQVANARLILDSVMFSQERRNRYSISVKNDDEGAWQLK